MDYREETTKHKQKEKECWPEGGNECRSEPQDEVRAGFKKQDSYRQCQSIMDTKASLKYI